MAYRVLVDFNGSPDGRYAVAYHAGDVVELTDSLAEVAVMEKWVEVDSPCKETKTKKAKVQ